MNLERITDLGGAEHYVNPHWIVAILRDSKSIEPAWHVRLRGDIDILVEDDECRRILSLPR